jgi:hypothetical protein
MRFMMLLKSDEQSETGAVPDPKVFEAMGKFNQDLVDAGAMLAGEGLAPSAEGAILRFRDGKVTVIDGPFAEAKELVAGYWMIQAKSKDEAVDWAKRCFETVNEIAGPAAGGDEGEIEVRQVFELEDFPVNENESGWREWEAEQRDAPAPQVKPGYKRYMGLRMADKATEAGGMPSEEELAAMGAYNERLVQAGVMLGGEGLHPSSKGAKVRYSKGKISVIDGPFAESKELIAGFSMLQAKSLDEVVEWAKQWPLEDAKNGLELRIRRVFDTEDFGDAIPPEIVEQEARQRAQAAAQRKQ